MADVQLRLPWQLDAESVRALAHGIHPNPFGVLGPQDSPEGRVIRAFLPGASKVEVLRRSRWRGAGAAAADARERPV